MQTRAPGFVLLNDRTVKVQQWQLFADRAVLTTLVHGDAAGTELIGELQEDAMTLAWDDAGPLAVKPELTHHRIAGSGPATVHRIEVTLWFNNALSLKSTSARDDKLDQILHELQLLRAEVAALRGQRRHPAVPAEPPLAAGRTLLDFDIDTDDA